MSAGIIHRFDSILIIWHLIKQNMKWILPWKKKLGERKKHKLNWRTQQRNRYKYVGNCLKCKQYLFYNTRKSVENEIASGALLSCGIRIHHSKLTNRLHWHTSINNRFWKRNDEERKIPYILQYTNTQAHSYERSLVRSLTHSHKEKQ